MQRLLADGSARVRLAALYAGKPWLASLCPEVEVLLYDAQRRCATWPGVMPWEGVLIGLARVVGSY